MPRITNFTREQAAQFKKFTGKDLAAALQARLDYLHEYRRLLIAAQDILYYKGYNHRDEDDARYYLKLNKALNEFDRLNSIEIDTLRVALELAQGKANYLGHK